MILHHDLRVYAKRESLSATETLFSENVIEL
jgi:hypothetical protein